MPPIHSVGSSHEPKGTLLDSSLRLLMPGAASLDLLGNLEVGDPLIGRVIKILQGPRILMSFRGTELVATTTVPLAEGERVRGIVQAKGPPLVLKLVREDLSQETTIFIRFRSLAARLLPTTKDHPVIDLLKIQAANESNWTEPLARWLSAIALGDGVSIDPQHVRAALIHGGMFYERRVREWVEAGGTGNLREAEIDLKGVALKLLGQVESDGKGAGFFPEKASESLKSLIDKVELLQTANWLGQRQGLGLICQIPLRFGGHLRTADLLVSLPHKKRGKKDGMRILLLLDLGGLGRFQIDATLSQKGVVAAIGVDREETAALVRSMVGDLRKGLENQKLTVVEIECFLVEKVVAKEDFFQELLALDETEGINIRV